MRNRRRFNIVMSILCTLMLAALAGLLWWENVQENKKSEELQQLAAEEAEKTKELENASKLTLFEDDSVDLLYDLDAICVIDYGTISSYVSYTSGYYSNASVKFTLPDDIYYADADKLYMLVFEAYSEESAVEITVQLNGKNSTYYLTCEPSAFYLPIDDFSSFSITLQSDFQNTYIGNISIIETGGINTNIKYGQYYLNDFSVYENSSDNNLSDESGRDILIDGDYAYYLTRNKLMIYTITSDGLNEIGSLSGLGNTSSFELLSDNLLVITSRENDVFFVDVSNPTSPSIVSAYDSLDMASGVAVCENYVFICSRYFGVEIVDITDITNPRLASIINTGAECLNCEYDNGYLFISNWSAQSIYIYDVSNPNLPEQKASINVDGNPNGIIVCDNYLYVSTGHNSASDSSDVLDGGYGAGHGMEIYDISDVENIIWCSTVKVDGRILYRSDDTWGYYINGDYAFLASTYAGTYVYNISDPTNPTRIGYISTKISSDSEKYSFTSSDTSIFPYNPEEYIEDPIKAIAFGDGVVYLAASSTGLYEIEFQNIDLDANEVGGVLPEFDGSYFTEMKDISVKNSITYSNENSVNAVDVSGDYVFLACGDAGIEVIDNTGNLLNSVSTQGAAQDIIINGQYAYVAEGNYGFEVYQINGADMNLISSYECGLLFETITQIRISNCYLIVQNGWTRYKTFDISDPNNIVEIEEGTTGTMYLKNLINISDSSNLLGLESGREIKLYSTVSGLQELGTVTNSIAGERDGMCEYNGNIIAIHGNGYVVFAADDVANGVDLSTLTVYKISDDYKLKGKVTCSDGVMVVTNATGKQVNIVDITDITSPSIISSFSVSGNPLIAKITDDYIYIPLCWQGLLIIER